MRFAHLLLAAALFSFGILPAHADDTQSEVRAALDANDYAKAAKLLRVLAEKGDGIAAFNLGVMYSRGQGVPRSDVDAATWFDKSARAGNAAAQLNLGVIYSNGQGVAVDLPRSYMWLDLASANLGGADGAQATRLRDKVAARMTPEQLQDAQDMSDNCKLAGVKSCD